jgi:hypothetical protein
MNSDMTSNTIPSPNDGETSSPGVTQEAGQKKPFVLPELIRHDTLPDVTTGFFGTFSP